MKAPSLARRLSVLPIALLALFAGGAVARVQDQCGPFTDVAPAYCPYVLEMYYLGITVGTSPTTYSPDSIVTRGQAAVFVSKGVNQAIARSSRRAALGQWWNTGNEAALGTTTVGAGPYGAACDGADVWVANRDDGTVSRVRASDGKRLETWTGADGASGVLIAMGRVFVTGATAPGKLYMIDPSQPAGAVTTVATVGDLPRWVAFDGSRIWTCNSGTFVTLSTVSIVEPGTTLPWSATTVGPYDNVELMGLAFDGAHMWLARFGGSDLLKLDSSGGVLQAVPVPGFPATPVFDGANLWAPLITSTPGEYFVSVVSVATGTVLQTLPVPGELGLTGAAFDGQRVMISAYGDSVALFRAADLSFIGSVATGSATAPSVACSDGINFWITLYGANALARF